MSPLITPCGIELKQGQIWRERDGRFTRLVAIESWNEKTERVHIYSGGQTTVAALSQFNGKSGGYVFERDPIGLHTESENPSASAEQAKELIPDPKAY
jgi:hypothetical protein